MGRLLKLSTVLAFVAISVVCSAQEHCVVGALPQAASRVQSLRIEIEHVKVADMDVTVPPALAEKIDHLKDALNQVSNAEMACAGPTVSPEELEKQLAEALHANPPEPPPNTVISVSDHRYDEILGSYGHNLRVDVERPRNVQGILTIQYSINVECGSDSMLLVYELDHGAWVEKLWWQAPLLKRVSDAFGDFFLTAFLRGPSTPKGREANWRVVVAHGTPWCMSRFSGFKIDVLAPGSNVSSPRVLWHTERAYSRFEYAPRIKSFGNTFELRLNADCMSFDMDHCFERRVIYRYTVDDSGDVRRVNPIGINARGFVEEWLAAPWSESRDFSALETAVSLEKIHEDFDPPSTDDGPFVIHSFGPVRACALSGVFQVQMNSTQEQMVPGKPGGDSRPLPSNYFRVRQVKDGYLMLAAQTEPDPACTGPNLMPTGNQ